MNIVVVGIGYVGLANAVLLAQNNDVTAVDVIPEKVNLVNKKRSPFTDPEIEDYLANQPLTLEACINGNSAYSNADFVVISTPTYYDPDRKCFDTASIETVIRQVMEINQNAIIVIRSTVPIGYTASIRERTGSNNILFSPEFLREGHALYDSLNPSRIIIGTPSDDERLLDAAKTFANLLKDGAQKGDIPVLFTGLTEAEAIKLFANAYLALRVAFFNELDTYAEMKGIDTHQIIEGVSYDPRIGDYYNNPSFGYGGYCLPKDTLQLLANYDQIPNNVIGAVIDSNTTRKVFIAERILEKAHSFMSNNNKNEEFQNDSCIIGIYRLIMKTGSDNFRQSSIQDVMRHLKDRGAKIVIYEPGLTVDTFLDFQVIHNLKEFQDISQVIVTNRYTHELQPVIEKVYTRDIYFRD